MKVEPNTIKNHKVQETDMEIRQLINTAHLETARAKLESVRAITAGGGAGEFSFLTTFSLSRLIEFGEFNKFADIKAV